MRLPILRILLGLISAVCHHIRGSHLRGLFILTTVTPADLLFREGQRVIELSYSGLQAWNLRSRVMGRQRGEECGAFVH